MSRAFYQFFGTCCVAHLYKGSSIEQMMPSFYSCVETLSRAAEKGFLLKVCDNNSELLR
jgi:hypothetical protein